MTRNDRIIEAVLASKSVAQAARLLDMGESTLRRKLRQPEVREALEEARQDLLRAALSQMHNLLGKALETVDRCLDEDQPSGVQLAAARLLIENVLRVSDVLDQEARLRKIEENLAEQPEGMPFRYERKQT